MFDAPVPEQSLHEGKVSVYGVHDLLFAVGKIGGRGSVGKALCRKGRGLFAGGEQGTDRRGAVQVKVLRGLDGIEFVEDPACGGLFQQGGQQKSHKEDGRQKEGGKGDPRLFGGKRLCAAVRQRRLFLRQGSAQLKSDIFLYALVGQNVGRLLAEHFFDVFHASLSSLSTFFSFFRASLFFQVTVPMGICSICATSLRL